MPRDPEVTEPHGQRKRAGRRRFYQAAIAVWAAATLLTPLAQAQRSARPASHVVYVESNDFRPGLNAVFGFRRGADGSLTPLPRSPFFTRGTGADNPTDALGPQDSDQDLIVSPDRRFLLATNGGSNTIAVFRIRSDGDLTHVPGSPFRSGGRHPVSLGLAGNILHVVNKDADPNQPPIGSRPNYTSFHFRPDGRLVPIPRATFTLPPLSSPTQPLISPNGRLMFDADIALFLDVASPPMVGQPALRSFRLLPDGRLAQAPGSPQTLDESISETQPPRPPFLPRIPLGLAAHPIRPILYAGVVTSDHVAVYTYNSRSGELTFRDSAPTSGLAICWLHMNRPGTRLYSVNQLDSSLSVFDTSNPLHPEEIQHLTVAGPGTLWQLKSDPADRFLYVVSARSNGFPTQPPGSVNQIHIFRIDADGLLTETPESPHPLPAGTTYRAQGIAVL